MHVSCCKKPTPLGLSSKNKKIKKEEMEENKMVEEAVDVEYISLHRYIRNKPSDTEVHAEHQLRADRGT